MRSSLYIDAFAGVAGDMLLGALVDLGVSETWLSEQLERLPVGNFTLEFNRVVDRGLSGYAMQLTSPAPQHYRHLNEIEAIIRQAGYSAYVTDNALHAFSLLAAAESRVHGCRPEQVHFHEVGALDTIIDICGYFLALDKLGQPAVFCSPLPMPSGTITIAHGEYPLPAPAITFLLQNFYVYGSTAGEELVTPTGAALLAASAQSRNTWPALRILKTGYGAGTPGRGPLPNLVRIILGESKTEIGEVTVIETQMDDITPELIAYAGNLLLKQGALDYFITPIYMKKSRPGMLLSVLCTPEREEEFVRLVLEHTSTLGVRYYRCERQMLPRLTQQIATPYGEVSLKVAFPPGGNPRITPEYEDCARLAQQHEIPLQEIYAAVHQAWSKLNR